MTEDQDPFGETDAPSLSEENENMDDVLGEPTDSGEDAPIHEPEENEGVGTSPDPEAPVPDLKPMDEQDAPDEPPAPVAPSAPPTPPTPPPVAASNDLIDLGAEGVAVKEDYKPIIQIIFDGGIHKNRKGGWLEREDIPGEPVEGIFDAMKSYMDAGYHLHVSSDRAQSQTGLTAVFNWMDENDIDIKCLHKCSIDDRILSNAVVTIDSKDFPSVQS